MAPSKSYISTAEAAERLGVSTARRVHQLIAEGRLNAIKCEPGDHPDRRVRNLVSVRSLNALLRKRAEKKR